MTTACGSTTSKQDTPSTPKPLDEAPFEVYLKILRKEGKGKEADTFEQECLQIFEELGYTADDLYPLEFGKVQQVIEIYATELNKQIVGAFQPQPVSENMLLGEGAEKLSPEALQRLVQRQMQLHEEEKNRLGMN